MTRWMPAGFGILLIASCDGAGSSADPDVADAAAHSPNPTLDAGDETSVTPVSTSADAGPDAGVCTPGELVPCYDGPPATKNVGRCHEGYRRCAPDGSALSACTRATLPAPAEDCATPDDDDCNGTANDGCACDPGDTRACYTGPAGTLGLGACHGGTQSCSSDRSGFAACTGEQLPALEQCSNQVDDDCDGLVDEEGTACACLPGATRSCYSGPAGTEGIGLCRAGFATCIADGSAFGLCVGEVLPKDERCGNYDDENCDGSVNEGGAGCVCRPGVDKIPCYSGPLGTNGVGFCHGGTYDCRYDGTGYYGPPYSCNSELTPQLDDCGAPGDEDCSGTELVCLQRAWVDEVAYQPGYRYPESVVGWSDLGEVVSMQRAYDGNWTLQIHGANGARLANIGVAGGGARYPLPIRLAAVTATASGIYLAGSCNGTFSFGAPPQSITCDAAAATFLVKLRRDGSIDWYQTIPATGGTLTDVRLGANGDVIASGRFKGVMTIDGASFGQPDSPGAFVMKVSSSGTRQWTRGFPTRDYEYSFPTVPAAIAAANGDVVAVMPVIAGTDLGSGALPASSLVFFRWSSIGGQLLAQGLADVSSWNADTYRLVEAPDQTFRLLLSGSGILGIGTTALPYCSGCGWVVGLATLGANGAVASAKSLGGIAYSARDARDIGLTPSGAILVASPGVLSGATFSGNTDLTVTRFASNGTAEGAYSQVSSGRGHTSVAISRTGRTAFVGVQNGNTGADYVEVREP